MKTYGGFLPFEIGRGQEYYRYSEDQIQYYNSGKTAAHFCIQQLKPQRLFLPRYYCPSTKGAIEKAAQEVGVKVIYYHVNFDLSADIQDDLLDSDAILLVNYFGVRRPDIESWMKTGAKLIIDNCQAFYSEPVMAENVLNFYSFKKDFGTPDGAFVIGFHVEDYHLPVEDGLSKADYLLGSLIEGTNKWYARKKEVDMEIASSKLQASLLTRKMIGSIDYEGIKSIRVANFKLYEKAFGADNLIKSDSDSVPYLYPLNLGIDIKKELIEHKIFVPTLWADTLEEKFEGTDEYLLSKNTLFLPIDQRYDENDIKYIISVIKDCYHK